MDQTPPSYHRLRAHLRQIWVENRPENEVEKPKLYIILSVVFSLSSVFTYRSPREQVYWPHESTNSSAQVWPSLVTACSELHSVLKAPPLPQES